MTILIRLLAAIAPFLLSVLFGWLIAEDYVSFGGGDKEILLAGPLLVWSLVYLCCYITLWWRRSALSRAVALSAGIATGVLAIAWLALFVTVWLRKH